MKRRLSLLAIILIIISNVFLIAFAPDTLSMVFVGAMLLAVVGGMFFGIFPMISYCNGIVRGANNLQEALVIPSNSAWETVVDIESIFKHKALDELFDSYKDKIKVQRESAQVLAEIDEYLNEDVIALRCWNTVISQIPSTLTGLGILGTFVGLILGISRLGFNSVDAALESVENLLGGIQLAFYTSIAGMILAIMFNILHKTIWNITSRELNVFVDAFHKNVIPTVEEQERYREQLYRDYVLEKLDRIPKSFDSASFTKESISMNEKILTPQIIQGIKDGEFDYVLQPKHDAYTKTVIAAEVIPRWNHHKLGNVPYSVFMPIVEESGLVVKLNRLLWESAFAKLGEWIKADEKIIPLAVNVSKTDLLADKGDISGFFGVMLRKYGVLPRMVEIEISQEAFIDAPDVAAESAKNLREMGFKVIIDDFDGNFIPLDAIDTLNVDELKLNIDGMDTRDAITLIENTYEQARAIPISVNGIKSMKQFTVVKKKGGTIVQGSYLSKGMEPDDILGVI